MEKIVTKWIDRTLIKLHYKVGLCTTKRDFYYELERLNLPKNQWPEWLANGSLALHIFSKAEKQMKR